MHSERIKKEINQLIASIEGVVSVYFKNTADKYIFKYNENELFNAASLMKIIVGLELLLRIEKGEIAEDSNIEIKNSFKSKSNKSQFKLLVECDSEKELYDRIGTEVCVIELLELMITKSSNLATNNLFALIDNGNSISQLLTSLKMRNTQIVRGVEDQKAFDAGIINYTTAEDVFKLFEFINEGVSTGNKYILTLNEILKRQEHNSIIPQLLPVRLRIAHKTGTIKSIIHDAGIISSDDGINYILVILSKNLVDVKKAIPVFTKISALFYKFVIENRVNHILK
ncbi:MAG: serine hydrolase [Paludibacter sp.]|nr:serine hydrolase [Paludibacter sp.]